MSNFQTSVEISLKSNMIAVLEGLGRELRGFDKQVLQATEQVDRLALALRKLGGLDKSVTKLVASMDKLKGAAGGSDNLQSNFDKAATAMRSVVSQSERLTGVLRENNKLSSDMAKATNRAATTGTNAPRRRGANAARAIGTNHSGLGDAVALGVVGGGIVHFGAEALSKGMQFGEMASFIGSDDRVTPADLTRMKGLADTTTKTAPGTTPVENLGLLYDLKNITGSSELAEKILPQVANLEAALRLIDKKNGGSGDAGFAAAKALELTGGMISEREVNGKIERYVDPEKLAANLNNITSSTLQYGGRGYNPREAMAFAKQARVAGMQLSDEYLYGVAPAITQATSGRIQGTALMSAAQVFEGGKLTPKSMDAMIQYKLASAGGITVEKDKRTGKKKEVVHAEAIYDKELLQSNPYEWAKKAGARLDAQGIHGKDQLKVMMQVMQRATMAGIFADFISLSPSVDKDLETRKHMQPNISGYLQQNDPEAKMQQFTAAWERLLTILGGQIMSDGLSLLDKLTAALTYLGDVAQKYPDMAKRITEVAVGLGAIAAAAAAAMVIIIPVVAAARAAKLLLGGGPAAEAAKDAVIAGGADAAKVASGAGPITAGELAAGIALPAAALAAIVIAHENMTPLTSEQAAKHAPWADPNADKVFGDGYTADGRTAEQVARTKLGEAATKLDATVEKLAAVPPPPTVQQTVQVRTEISLDGRTIGNAVSEHLVRQMDRPSTGDYDPRIGPIHITTPW